MMINTLIMMKLVMPRCLNQSRTTCWRSSSSPAAPSSPGSSSSSGGCSGWLDHSSEDASKSRQNENILWLQSDYEVQGRQEEGICSSVRLSDSNDHNRWFCHDMSIKAFYIVIGSFAALNCANVCLPMCGLLNMWAIEQSVK